MTRCETGDPLILAGLEIPKERESMGSFVEFSVDDQDDFGTDLIDLLEVITLAAGLSR